MECECCEDTCIELFYSDISDRGLCRFCFCQENGTACACCFLGECYINCCYDCEEFVDGGSDVQV